MHRRFVTREDFDRIAIEMTKAQQFLGVPEIITGRHEDHGFVVLFRQGDRCVALVDEASYLEASRDEEALIAQGLLLRRKA